MDKLRPSTIAALVVLIALIFVPSFFIDVNEMKRNIPPDANGREPPPVFGVPGNNDVHQAKPQLPPPPENRPSNGLVE
mgnify:CR=1 FL=1|jgi:hypothetical protein